MTGELSRRERRVVKAKSAPQRWEHRCHLLNHTADRYKLGIFGTAKNILN